MTDSSNFDKQCSDAHFVQFLFVLEIAYIGFLISSKIYQLERQIHKIDGNRKYLIVTLTFQTYIISSFTF